MKTKLTSIALGAIMGACASSTPDTSYTVTAPVDDSFNGKTAFLVNYDTGEKIDSAIIADATATFAGKIDEPAFARIIVEGNRLGYLIVEPGNITVKDRVATGSTLNDMRIAIREEEERRFAERFHALEKVSPDRPTTLEGPGAEELMAEYHAFNDSVFNANIDNPIAYIMYIDVADMQPVDSIKAFIEKYPVFAKSKRLQGYITAARNREATSPGHKFLDFTITTDSTSQKLSDFAGKGKPVLVDFWASWCGPCIRETKVLKELLAEFGPQGLEVLGVAVWDEPENTLEAIKNHKLPWPQIIGAQSVPTEAYGITSIPCIMLVAPDGTILTRGTQGDDLRNQVKAYFDGTLQPDTTAVIY